MFAQRYDAAGAPQGAEFRVNTYTPSFQFGPIAASDPNGNFVVVWGSYQDGNDTACSRSASPPTARRAAPSSR